MGQWSRNEVFLPEGIRWLAIPLDRLTPAEKRYLRAMAELSPGPHRSGDVAEQLGRVVTSLGPTRNKLISKGMVWSPDHAWGGVAGGVGSGPCERVRISSPV